MALSLNGTRTLAMEGSSSEESYEKHSDLQNRNFHAIGKPLLEEAVQQLLCNLAARNSKFLSGRRHITIADFGCSYGRNTLDCVDVILSALQCNWAERRTSCPSTTAEKMPDIQYFFADLPSNDFNSLFESLQPYLHRRDVVSSPSSVDVNLPKISAAGIAGSFHGRLLPSASLDLAICTYALHWLSQAPPSVLDMSSSAWNGGLPWIHRAPQGVVDAFTLQSRIDVTKFLKSRAQELASGGILFLLLGSRNGSVESGHASRWDVFNHAWKELVKEEVITMEELDTFNLPMFFFNEDQLKDMLKSVPELKLLHIETIEEDANEVKFSLAHWTEALISAIKPTVEAHMGKDKSTELFKRLKHLASKNQGLMVARDILVASLQRL